MGENHESYFDPIALLAEDAVSCAVYGWFVALIDPLGTQSLAAGTCSSSCPKAGVLRTGLCPRAEQPCLLRFCRQLVPCEFNHAIKDLGRLLDPTSSSKDVSEFRAPLQLLLQPGVNSKAAAAAAAAAKSTLLAHVQSTPI
jgi:hypothetical protein